MPRIKIISLWQVLWMLSASLVVYFFMAFCVWHAVLKVASNFVDIKSMLEIIFKNGV